MRRKAYGKLLEWKESAYRKPLILRGARQVGKTWLMKEFGQNEYKSVLYANFDLDERLRGLFDKDYDIDRILLALQALTGVNVRAGETLIILDEIQEVNRGLGVLKYFCENTPEHHVMVAGSLLGIALHPGISFPVGKVDMIDIHPLDYEEFLWATGVGKDWIDGLRSRFEREDALDENTHNVLMKRFKYYLLVGGMPEAINNYLKDRNMARVRQTHKDIHDLYRIDASQYDQEHRLIIRKIFDLIPSNLENKKKRIVYKDIEGVKGKKFSDYANEFEYLTNSGVALDVSAISNPRFPLVESEQKRLVKLYLNDVGLLTGILYGLNVNAVLQDIKSINLGTVYESVVAQELAAHGFKLHYYDNKQRGEVDFLIDDYNALSVLPLEIKSGKDYTEHSALSKFVATPEYGIGRAIVFSNERSVYKKKGVTYMPVYYCMFLQNHSAGDSVILPELDAL